jgi:uncharacterized OB-fold protein
MPTEATAEPTAPVKRVPVEEGLFTWPSDAPVLLGSRCTECGNHTFPAQRDCPRCSGDSTEVVELGRTGTLWTWTIQGFPPKAPPYAGDVDPETYEPFGVGYLDMGGKLLVESRLTLADPAELDFGMEMELTVQTLYVDDDGNEVVTFAFGPLRGDGGGGS